MIPHTINFSTQKHHHNLFVVAGGAGAGSATAEYVHTLDPLRQNRIDNNCENVSFLFGFLYLLHLIKTGKCE